MVMTELTRSPGMYCEDIESTCQSHATVQQGLLCRFPNPEKVKESLVAPLPTIEMRVKDKIFPELTAKLPTDFPKRYRPD
jgi:hypothetical protein